MAWGIVNIEHRLKAPPLDQNVGRLPGSQVAKFVETGLDRWGRDLKVVEEGLACLGNGSTSSQDHGGDDHLWPARLMELVFEGLMLGGLFALFLRVPGVSGVTHFHNVEAVPEDVA